MFEHEIHREMAHARLAALQRDWGSRAVPAKYALGAWLIRLGRRLAPEPAPRRSSALAHEALPRC
jgi:hypothetical protein